MHKIVWGVFMYKNIVLLGDYSRGKATLFNMLVGTINQNYDEIRVGSFLYNGNRFRLFALPFCDEEIISSLEPSFIIITDMLPDYEAERIRHNYSNVLFFSFKKRKKQNAAVCFGINELLEKVGGRQKVPLKSLIAVIIVFLLIFLFCVFLLNIFINICL